MEKSREMLDALFMNANEGILVTDQKGTIVIANPTVERQFGYELGELMGRKVEELVPRSLTSRHTQHREGYFSNPHARPMGKGLDLFGLKKDQSIFPVEISLSTFKTSEGVFALAFIIDISARKEHEIEIVRAHQEILDLNDQLEKRVEERTNELANAIKELSRSKAEVIKSLNKEKDLNELKSRFVTMASHEFRTPLATILSSVSLIAKYNEKDEEPKRQKHVERIKSSVSNLTEILNNFLSLGKLEEGVIRNNPEPLNVTEFINNLMDDHKSLLRDGQQILCNCDDTLELIKLDKYLLQNILLNLLSNAIKYSGENQKVVVSANRSKDKLYISVSDEGIGIPEAEQVHLFERFFRAKNAEHIQGTGLGLHIIKKYTELMQGTVSLQSEAGKGSTFTLEFPI
jgi:PAS domain S-box-containing protein